MLVACENCKSKFNLDDSLVKESGSKVRCSNCQDIFTVYRPSPVEELSPDLDLEGSSLDESEELVEEPLDFDLFESEGDQDEEEVSLEDFGLGEEPAGEAQEQIPVEKQAVAEEEITAQDLGFEQGSTEPTEEAVPEEIGEEEISPEGLDLEEEPALEEDLSSFDEEGEIQVEDELSFEDLSLEEEPEGDATLEAPEELKTEEEPEEELSMEGVSLEEGISEEAVPEEIVSADEQPGETADDAEISLPEGVPVASWEEGEETDADAMEEIPSLLVTDQPPARKRISLPLMIILVLVLVGGGAYAAFTLLKGENVRIPFLESLAGPGKSKTMDPGNLNISMLEDLITGGFVESRSIGRVFVIKGKIKSSYPEARSFIRIKGILYSKDGKIAKDRIVYCGNILPDGELQTLDRAAIKKKLSNRFGDNKSNFRVPSGKVLPFMVVFSDLPEELGEFSVEVVDSISG
jgi:predicted Zn finger-like uncharacterized protein